MKRKVAVLHTSTVFVNDDPILRDLFAEILPEVELLEFVDTDLRFTNLTMGLGAKRQVSCLEPSGMRRPVLSEVPNGVGHQQEFESYRVTVR